MLARLRASRAALPAAVGAAWLALLGGAAASDSPKQLFAQARELFDKGHYRDAVALIDKIEVMEPGRSIFGAENLYNLKGSCLTALRYFQHARREFERALKAQPGSFDMRYNLAEIDFLQEHFESAADKFAALKATDRGRAYNDLLDYKIGMCRLMNGGGKEIVSHARLHGKHSAVHLFLNAAASLRAGKPEQAEITLLLARNKLAEENYRLYEDSLIECGLLAPPKLSGRERREADETRRKPLSLGVGRVVPREEPAPPAETPAPATAPPGRKDES